MSGAVGGAFVYIHVQCMCIDQEVLPTCMYVCNSI